MVKITEVEQGSRAHAHGILAGDVLVKINGKEINDVLDYRFYLADRKVKLSLERDGRAYLVKIKKDEYDDIGLLFETPLMDKKHSCKNGCIFCFIDQNPEGLRDTIYFKDDDSRLSFIHGNYITLTNLTDKDVDRIVKMKFSPINISVHTTNPELRVKMMKNKRSGEVLEYLDRFKKAKLSMCGQIVLCKGINDGEELVRSMNDLSRYHPYMTSVAIVPAGLTKFRDKLYPLTDFSEQEAREVIELVNGIGDKLKQETGSRLFFCADEFYLKAKAEIPGADYYEEYPQIENGVGLIRSFLDEFGIATEDISELSRAVVNKRSVAVATGVAAYETIKSSADSIMKLCDSINIRVFPIVNKFFGESITVAGLLTGKDISEQLASRLEGFDELLIPCSAVRREELDFLCGMKVSELEEKLGIKIRLVSNDGFEFLNAVFGIEE